MRRLSFPLICFALCFAQVLSEESSEKSEELSDDARSESCGAFEFVEKEATCLIINPLKDGYYFSHSTFKCEAFSAGCAENTTAAPFIDEAACKAKCNACVPYSKLADAKCLAESKKGFFFDGSTCTEATPCQIDAPFGKDRRSCFQTCAVAYLDPCTVNPKQVTLLGESAEAGEEEIKYCNEDEISVKMFARVSGHPECVEVSTCVAKTLPMEQFANKQECDNVCVTQGAERFMYTARNIWLPILLAILIVVILVGFLVGKKALNKRNKSQRYQQAPSAVYGETTVDA